METTRVGWRTPRSTSSKSPRPRRDVVGVHGAGQRHVGGRVEAVDQLPPLVAQVALDRERSAAWVRRPKRSSKDGKLR